MKKIEAIIQPAKVNEVQRALLAIGVDVMTCCEVREFGPQNRHVEIYRSREHIVNYLPKIRIDVVVAEQKLEQALNAIFCGTEQNEAEAGKVIISNLTAPVEMMPV